VAGKQSMDGVEASAPGTLGDILVDGGLSRDTVIIGDEPSVGKQSSQRALSGSDAHGCRARWYVRVFKRCFPRRWIPGRTGMVGSMGGDGRGAVLWTRALGCGEVCGCWSGCSGGSDDDHDHDSQRLRVVGEE
jgi:hypothetical protein